MDSIVVAADSSLNTSDVAQLVSHLQAVVDGVLPQQQ